MKVIPKLTGAVDAARRIRQRFNRAALSTMAAVAFLFSIFANPVYAAPVTINGAQTFQTIDGFGVNANSHGWNSNNELKPAIDALIDQGGLSLFLVIMQNSNWEGTNDNANANVMNWTYYNTIYNSADFQKMWGLASYLNQRGISNGLTLRAGGAGPLWLGGSSLGSGMENEYAEMIASMLVYARSNQHIQFREMRAANEPDGTSGQGVGMTSSQYVTMLHDLAVLLDTNGLSDVRFSAPDLTYVNTSLTWINSMMADSYLMSKVAHYGLHAYLNQTPDATGVTNFINSSAYPNMPFWMTEFNVWCSSCSYGQANAAPDNSWTFARGIASYLLTLMAEGASAGTIYEAYDSQHYLWNSSTGQNIPFGSTAWSYWGLMAINDINASPRTYTPRKGLYTMGQIAKFVRPGARRIGSGSPPSGITMQAFYNTNNAQFTIAGVNANGSASALSFTLTSLPTIPSVDLYFTTSSSNMVYGGRTSVTSGTFSVTVPADSVFSLTSSNAAPAHFLTPTVQNGSVNLVLTGTPGASYQIQVSSNLVTWPTLTNVVATNGTASFTDTNTASSPARYYRALSGN